MTKTELAAGTRVVIFPLKLLFDTALRFLYGRVLIPRDSPDSCSPALTLITSQPCCRVCLIASVMPSDRQQPAAPTGRLFVVEVLSYVRRYRRLVRDGSPARPPRLSHSSWALTFLPGHSSSALLTPTETAVWTIRDGEPRTATLTFTQLLSSGQLYDDELMLNVLRCQLTY